LSTADLNKFNKKNNTVDRFDDVVLPVFVTAVLTMLQTRTGGNYDNVNQLCCTKSPSSPVLMRHSLRGAICPIDQDEFRNALFGSSFRLRRALAEVTLRRF